MTTTTLFWEFASAALGIAMGLLASPGLPAAQNPPQAVVGVAPVEVREITADTEFVGRVEAINSVDIRARVTGVIQDRPFQEGQLVRKGDLLYLIERAPYEAALAGAKAALAGAQATERNAHRALQRAQQLARTGTATQVALEQAKTTYESAVANSGTADANLRQAQLNLDYTRIISPIDGRIGQAAYSTTIMASSTTSPIASTRANKVMVLASRTSNACCRRTRGLRCRRQPGEPCCRSPARSSPRRLCWRPYFCR